MKKCNCSLHLLLTICTCFLILSCSQSPDVVGKWRQVGKTATLEFFKDGRFQAVDNQGMAVSGNYTIGRNGSVVFEIDRREKSPEVVRGTMSVQGDELTLISGDGEGADRYRREK